MDIEDLIKKGESGYIEKSFSNGVIKTVSVYSDYGKKLSNFISKIPMDIQYEISKKMIEKGLYADSLFYLRDFYLIYLYHFKQMSCGEIFEKYKGYFVNKLGTNLSARSMQRIANKYGVIRTHDEALRHRIKMGRMDYKKRNLDYKSRKIYYSKRDEMHNYKYVVGLNKILEKGKITQEELAKKLGVTNSTMSRWANCRTRVRRDFQEKICKIFGVESSVLFSDKKRKHLRQFFYHIPDLKKLIEEKLENERITLKELSGMTKVNPTTLGRILNHNTAISTKNIKKLLNFFGLERSDLFTTKLNVDSYKNYLCAVALNSYLLKTGKTKEDLARYLGVRNLTVSRWASLEQRVSPKYAQLISDYLKTSVDNVFRTDTKIDGLLKLKPAKKEYLLDVKRIHDETGRLEETGRRFNITKERVKQILKEGNELGFFNIINDK